MADMANAVPLLIQAWPAVCYTVPLFRRSVNIFLPILKQLRLVFSIHSDHAAAEW